MKRVQKNSAGTKRVFLGLGHLCLHATGLTVVAGAILWLTLGLDHLRLLLVMHGQFGASELFLSELGIHLGISALLWTLVYLVGSALVGAKKEPLRVVRKARGTVITETIIIMPVLLLLILGLSQLAILNIAGMLMNYGASQAARAVWVWAPELEPLNGQPARRGVSVTDVEDRARIQAALALTPVAPSDFRAADNQGSIEFEMMRASILAGQVVTPPNDAGRMTLDQAHSLYQFTGSEERAFYRALDSTNFSSRSVRKFTFAYMATTIELILEGEVVGAEVIYQQKIMFPFITSVFGTPGSVAGLPGNYTEYRRRITKSAQVAPNAELPQR